MNDTPDVFVVNAENFAEVVIETSYRMPVLVDFWADWCAPCRALMPMLANLANEFRGSLRVAKVDTEEQREIAAEYQIRSLPTVKLFRNGVVMDEFMGALPEGAIREFVDPYVERASDKLAAEAMTKHRTGDSAEAVALLNKGLDDDPSNYRLHRQLLEVLMSTRRFREAEEVIQALPANQQTSADILRISSRLRFGMIAEGAPPALELERTVEADPSNTEARYQLSAVHVLAGNFEAALEQLLQITRRDRAFRDDAGRKGMIDVFELLEDDQSALVSRYRGLMSSALH
ncbi:MAG: thioredoxin [Gammaproteobacteria bacterium]|nr:thioredoxin [Gammaproteobacteria bacterium]